MSAWPSWLLAWRAVARLLVLAALASAAGSALAVKFQVLGPVPAGKIWIVPTAISDDGTVIVGYTADTGLGPANAASFATFARSLNRAAGQRAWRWTAATGFTDLGALEAGRNIVATGVSADGRLVVGTGDTINGRRAFVWTEAGGLKLIAITSFCPASGTCRCESNARSVSADGTVIMGRIACVNGASTDVYRVKDGAAQSLGTAVNGEAVGISGSGAVVVGRATTVDASGARHVSAIRWSGGSTLSLGVPPETDSGAVVASSDGSVIAGYRMLEGITNKSRLFRWTSAGVTTVGGVLDPGSGDEQVAPIAMSGDGNVIGGVGIARSHVNGATDYTAWLWTPARGMRQLVDVLTQADASLAEQIVVMFNSTTSNGLLRLRAVTAASADGRFLVGFAQRRGQAAPEAFLVDFEEGADPNKPLGPCPCDYPPVESSGPQADGPDSSDPHAPSAPRMGFNAATGNNMVTETDFVGGPTTGLAFLRYYNTQDRRNGALGANWFHTYARTLRGFMVGTTFMVASRPDGRGETFFKQLDGTWLAERDVRSRLTTTATGWELRTPDDTVERYTADGNCAAIITRSGLTTTLFYDSKSRLTSVRGPFGHTLRFTHDENGRMTQMIAPDGGITQYGHDGAVNLVAVTYPDLTQKSYEYKNGAFKNHLTGIIDEKGATYARYEYDVIGRLTATEYAGGVGKTTVVQALNGTFVTGPKGATHTYSFHPSRFGVSRTKTITAPPGVPCMECGGKAFTYDANGFIAKKTDWNGHDTTYVMDARGLENARTEAANTPQARRIITTWHPIFHLPLKIVEPHRVTDFLYDAKGNLLKKTVTAGSQVRVWTYTYTPLGQVLTIDGPRTDAADVVKNDYNADGTLASTTNALGQVTRYTAYDANGRPLSMVDPNGLITQMSYDKRGRMLTRNVGGLVTTYAYDAAGQLTKTTQPDGSFTINTYDAAHRLTQVANQRGEKIVYTLDAAGNRIREETVNASGTVVRSRTNQYDQINRLIASSSPEGSLGSYQYDDNGNATRAANGEGEATAMAYDGLNRRISSVDPLRAETLNSYDAQDNLTLVTDPLRHNTQYSYDGLDNRTTITSPDTGVTRNVFDAAGNVVSTTDAAGRLASSSFDALNRVTQQRYGGTTPSAFTYDVGVNGIGKLTGLTDSAGSTSWNYDLLGRPIVKKQTTGAVTLKAQYAYDSGGHLKSFTYPSGAVAQYSFTNDQLTQISVNGTPILSGITYEPFGPANGWSWGTGASVTRTFDKDGRIESYPLGSRTRTLTYDRAHRITGYTDTNGSNASYLYDDAGRLTQANVNRVSEVYGYDLNGNRTSARTFGGTAPVNATYGYASGSNHLTRLNDVVAQALRQILYDATGNIVGDGLNNYTYDGRNRLSQVTNAKGLSAYLVNGLGQRLTKYLGTSSGGTVLLDLAGDVNRDGKLDTTDLRLIALMAQGASPVDLAADCDHDGKVMLADVTCTQAKIADIRANPTKYVSITSGITYFYDEAGHLVGEYDQAGKPIQETIYFGDMPVAVLKDGKIYQIYADHLNTPRVITDSRDAEVWKWEGDAFGTTAPASTTSPAFVYNLRFPGQYFDSETGLHYNGFRDYNPSTGRYIQSDPIGLAGGINTFAYVESNPLTKLDPDGKVLFGLAIAVAAYNSGFIASEFAQLVRNDFDIGQVNYNEAFKTGAKAAASATLGRAAAVCVTAAESVMASEQEVEVPKEEQAGSKVFSREKQALVDMAKADKKTGVTRADMKAYEDLNKGLKDPFPTNRIRTDEGHLRGAPHSRVPHGHVGPVDYIPILDP